MTMPKLDKTSKPRPEIKNESSLLVVTYEKHFQDRLIFGESCSGKGRGQFKHFPVNVIQCNQ